MRASTGSPSASCGIEISAASAATIARCSSGVADVAVENQRLQSPIVIRIQHRGAFFAAHGADDAIELLAERGDEMLRRIAQSEANELGH